VTERLSFFATCAPGLEPVLHEEVRALRLTRSERQTGGVYFEGTFEDARRANLWLRTAVRVLMQVARFPSPDGEALYAGVREVDWSRFLLPEGNLVVDAHSNQSLLDHTRFIEQRTKDGIVDQFREQTGSRPSVDRDNADLGIHVHVFRDRCRLLVDTSGRALHRRGWRQAQGRAPLAETLAAGIVLLSGWDRRAPLLDPFCGSGTILIEAALIAGGMAPGLFRDGFGFERWPGHDAARWHKEKERARAAARLPKKLRLIGSDSSAESIEGARANAEAAGLGEHIELEVRDVRNFAPRPGWNAQIVSNLPYGRRIGQQRELESLYTTFGQRLKAACAGYRVALLTSAGSHIQALGLGPTEETSILNGGIDCRLLCTTME